MELLEYMKLRWTILTGLLLAGVIMIGVVGLGVGKSDFRAGAQLIVRPPATASVYATDPDRFINTEMALLYSNASLRSFVRGTDVSVPQLARSLKFSHSAGTEVVNLEVTSSDPRQAVSLVNKVADTYVREAVERNAEPAKRQLAQLRAQVREAQTELAAANATIERATSEYVQSNPDRGIPATASLSPKAYSRQTFFTSQLQRLSQAQVDLGMDSDVSTQSRVLRSATEASSSNQRWAPTTFLAALVGWLLILLTLSMVGLALSKRVLGEGRWMEATEGSSMVRPVRLRRRTQQQRRQTLRRVLASLRAVGAPDVSTVVAYLPEATSAMEQKTAFLVEGLTDGGVPVREAGSLYEALPTPQSPPGETALADSRVLLLVDASHCHVDEAALLGDYPASVQRLMVPVLV